MKTLKRVLIIGVFLLVPFFLQAEDHFGFGVGFTTDSWSLGESGFTIPLSNFYYEYGISGIVIGTINIYGYNGFIPEIEANIGVLLPFDPIKVKLAIGLFDDVVISGHGGVMLSGSVIIDRSIELKLFSVPQGVYSQPKIAFQEGLVDGYLVYNDYGMWNIQKGYVGLLLGIRF